MTVFPLGNVEADNPAGLWHPPSPFLARRGSHAHATVRVEEGNGPVPVPGTQSGNDALHIVGGNPMSARLSAAEADVGTAPRASANVRHPGRLTVAGRYAYIGYQKGPEGTAILDIEDPARPRLVSTIMPGHPASHSHKVRVAGDVMAVNSELEPGKLRKQDYPDGGFRLYDIADRSNPKLISFVRTHGKGVHRFDMDERYAYISSEMEGFVGNILVIYDISRPAKVSEVGRWWMPGQNVGAGETPHPRKTEHRLHHAMRAGDQAYAGCWHSGYAIIDMSDLGRPRT